MRTGHAGSAQTARFFTESRRCAGSSLIPQQAALGGINDDLVDGTSEGIELVERSDARNWVRRVFWSLEKDNERALQMVVIEGMRLRQAAQHVCISAKND